MRHAANYSAYAKQDGQPRHSPNDHKVELVEGVPCCGLCSYPLEGVYLITLDSLASRDWLMAELRKWGRTDWQVGNGLDSVFVFSLDAVDVATETFANMSGVYRVEKLAAKTKQV